MNKVHIPGNFKGFNEELCKEFLANFDHLNLVEISSVKKQHLRANARNLVELLFNNYIEKGLSPQDVCSNLILDDIYSKVFEYFVSDHFGILTDSSHPDLRPLGPFPSLDILSDSDLNKLQLVTALFQEEYAKKLLRLDVDTRENIYTGKWRAIELMRDGICLPAARYFQESLKHLLQMDIFSSEFPKGSLAYSLHVKRIVTISRLYPSSRILPHFGTSQSRLRIHIPLTIPPGDCYIFCHNIQRSWDARVPLILNDAYIHFVDNNSTAVREVVLVDIHHPDLFQLA